MERKINFTAKDKLNALTGSSLKDIAGSTVTADGIYVGERPDSDGVAKLVGIIKVNGETYSTISTTAIRTLDAVIDYMEDEKLDTIDLDIRFERSKNNRDYLVIRLAD